MRHHHLCSPTPDSNVFLLNTPAERPRPLKSAQVDLDTTHLNEIRSSSPVLVRKGKHVCRHSTCMRRCTHQTSLIILKGPLNFAFDSFETHICSDGRSRLEASVTWKVSEFHRIPACCAMAQGNSLISWHCGTY